MIKRTKASVQRAWKGRWQRGNEGFHVRRRKATREQFVHCFFQNTNSGTSNPINQEAGSKEKEISSYETSLSCKMPRQGCGDAKLTRAQKMIGQLQGQKLGAGLQKHGDCFGLGKSVTDKRLQWRTSRSPARASRPPGTGWAGAEARVMG